MTTTVDQASTTPAASSARPDHAADHVDHDAGHGGRAMTGDVDFDHCSAYFSCRRCGAMVAPGDRERHRRWHRSTTPTTTDRTVDQEDR